MPERPPALEELARIYRALLHAYPRGDRESLGPELEDFFRRRVRETWRTRGPIRAHLVALASLVDVVRCGLIERLHPSGWRLGAVYGGKASDVIPDLARDVRLAVRGLSRAPAFTVVAVLTLALGIGANTAVFSVLRALVLTPLPYDGLDRLVVIRRELVKRGIPYDPASPADVVDYRAAAGLEEVAAVMSIDPILEGLDGKPERLTGASVTSNFFRTLRVAPILGRDFGEEDGLPSDPASEGTTTVPVILSHGFWVRRFGADPGVVGSTIHVGPANAVVVGVLPVGFRFVTSEAGRMQSDQPDVWTTLRIDPEDPSRRFSFLYTFARMKPGVTVAQAQEQLDAITTRQRERFSTYEAAGTQAQVVPFQVDAGTGVRPVLFMLFGAVTFVLLIACVNVASLLLVRASTRTREVSVRAALGGGRGRILREMFAEAGVIAALGGVAGIALASATLPLLGHLIPASAPRLGVLSLDPTVLEFSVVTTVLSAVLFGLYPAARSSRGDVMSALRGHAGAGGARSVAHARLVVVEAALSFVLVTGAGLMLRSFVDIRRVDPGFRPEGVLSFHASLPGDAYRTVEERYAVMARMRERLESTPGIEVAGAASDVPLGGSSIQVRYGNEAAVAEGDETRFRLAWFRTAQPGFFEAVGTPVVEGRTFTDADMADGTRHYVVVDQRLARANWPGASAVGKRVLAKVGTPPLWFEVIGVVRDQRQVSLAEETQETIWFSDRDVRDNGSAIWEVRGPGDAVALTAAVKAAVADVEPRVFLEDFLPLSDFVDRAQAPTRLVLGLVGVFAGIALALAVVGLYGVMAYLVRERTEEFGLRMALGASQRGVFRIVLRRGMVLSATGVALGLGGTLLITRTLESVLVGVSPTDPLTLGSGAVLFTLVAVAACLAPALRAVRVDPMVALRRE